MNSDEVLKKIQNVLLDFYIKLDESINLDYLMKDKINQYPDEIFDDLEMILKKYYILTESILRLISRIDYMRKFGYDIEFHHFSSWSDRRNGIKTGLHPTGNKTGK